MPARIDDEQHVAFLHKLAGLEPHFLDVTGDAWADVDCFNWLDAAGEFVPLDDLLLFDGRHGHVGRRGLDLRGGTAAAGEHKHERAEHEQHHGEHGLGGGATQRGEIAPGGGIGENWLFNDIHKDLQVNLCYSVQTR